MQTSAIAWKSHSGIGFADTLNVNFEFYNIAWIFHDQFKAV